MLEIYWVVVFIVLLMTLPYASRKLAYSYNPGRGIAYDALTGLNNGERKMSYLLSFAIFVILVLTCVNKPEYMADVSMYKTMYEAGGQENSHKSIEPTFGWITRISPTFMVLLLIYAVLSVGSHLLGIVRNSPNIWLSMMVYMLVFFVLHDIIQIRAAVACGLILVSIRYIYERKWYYYFPLILVASLFHYSALSFLPMFFLPRKRMIKWVWVGLLVISIFLSLFDMRFGLVTKYLPLKVVEMYVSSYIGNRNAAGTSGGFNWTYLVQSLVLIILVIRVDKIQKHYPFAPVCLALSIFSQMCYLLLGDVQVLQTRMGELLGVADIFTLAMIPMLNRRLYYLLFFVSLLLVLFHLNATLIMVRGV